MVENLNTESQLEPKELIVARWEYCEVGWTSVTYYRPDGRQVVAFRGDNANANIRDWQRRGVDSAAAFSALPPNIQSDRAMNQNRYDERARTIAYLGLQGWEAVGVTGEPSSLVILFKRQF